MAFDKILRRHFWAVLISLIGVAAFLDAQGITQLIGAGLAADEKQLSAPPLAPRTPPSAGSAFAKATSADPILARNPFDSVTGPLNKVEEPSGQGTQPPADLSNPYNAPPCDGVKVLIIAASADPNWSFAAFAGPGGDKKSILRRRGGEVSGKQVVFVGWDRVWLTSSGQLCQAEMFRPANAEAPPAPTPAMPKPAPGGGGAGSVPPDIAKGVVKTGPTEFNVDRSVVDRILENQAELMRQARIVPEQENGKVVGIRLFGVRPDTLLGVLGMENGDRLEKINGFEMASPEKALEAYARLRTADKLTIQINRRGQPMNLDYNIK
jgi:general secretion pathway protein C